MSPFFLYSSLFICNQNKSVAHLSQWSKLCCMLLFIIFWLYNFTSNRKGTLKIKSANRQKHVTWYGLFSFLFRPVDLQTVQNAIKKSIRLHRNCGVKHLYERWSFYVSLLTGEIVEVVHTSAIKAANKKRRTRAVTRAKNFFLLLFLFCRREIVGNLIFRVVLAACQSNVSQVFCCGRGTFYTAQLIYICMLRHENNID